MNGRRTAVHVCTLRLALVGICLTATFALFTAFTPTVVAHAQSFSTPAEPATLSPPAPASARRAELQGAMPQHRLIGQGRLTFWGFEVYDASLWALPGFEPDKLFAEAFALELAYLRDFSSADIAERSIAEMRRSAAIGNALAKTWTAELQRVLPEIKKGDRVTGLYRPGLGAQFIVNGKVAGDIGDPEFARLFFGIWLSPNTSEPALRTALLAGAAR